jgi:hypothetical protein
MCSSIAMGLMRIAYMIEIARVYPVTSDLN